MKKEINSSTDIPGNENRTQANVDGDAGREKQRAGCETPKFTPPPLPPIKAAKEPATVAGTNCPKCGQPLKVEYGTGYCHSCRVIVDPKPQTKADRIRAMSDAELAHFLYCLRPEFGKAWIEKWLSEPAKEVTPC